MRRSAFASLQRGVANLFANWQLLVVQLVRSFVVTLLAVAGALPVVLAIGFGTVRALLFPGPGFRSPSPLAIEALHERLTAAVLPLALGLFVACCVWTVALLVSSYFHAGTFGVLAAGDRRAASSDSGRRAFGAFTLGAFTSFAERHVWRFFLLVNLFLLLGLAAFFLLAGGLGLTALLAANDAPIAAAVAACCTVLATGVGALALAIWWQLSLARSVVLGESLWRSVGGGLSVLVRRVGALVVFFVVLAAAGLALYVVLLPAAMVVELAVRDGFWVYVVFQVFMTLVQSVAGGALGLVFSGAVVALVGGELSRSAAELE